MSRGIHRSKARDTVKDTGSASWLIGARAGGRERDGDGDGDGDGVPRKRGKSFCNPLLYDWCLADSAVSVACRRPWWQLCPFTIFYGHHGQGPVNVGLIETIPFTFALPQFLWSDPFWGQSCLCLPGNQDGLLCDVWFLFITGHKTVHVSYCFFICHYAYVGIIDWEEGAHFTSIPPFLTAHFQRI